MNTPTFEDLPYQALSAFATRSFKRRFTPRSYSPKMDEGLRDVWKLLESKGSRRLEDKTQVLTEPTSGHIRTRASHTNEVIAHSIRVAEFLGLNVNLVWAIALGHDIGHVPFGHQGEAYFAKRLGRPFAHEIMSVIVAQRLEREGSGLNLTWQTLDGMFRHGGDNASPTMTPEASIVRVCDKFAYVFADFNDFKRINYPIKKELTEAMKWFGDTQRARSERCILAMCEESIRLGKVSFLECEEAKRFKELKRLMYEVYEHITAQNVASILGPVWDFLESTRVGDPWLILALMTDRDVLRLHEKPLLDVGHLMQTSVGELLSWLPTGIDPCKVDLDW